MLALRLCSVHPLDAHRPRPSSIVHYEPLSISSGSFIIVLSRKSHFEIQKAMTREKKF
jgi:hypothetical protein